MGGGEVVGGGLVEVEIFLSRRLLIKYSFANKEFDR